MKRQIDKQIGPFLANPKFAQTLSELELAEKERNAKLTEIYDRIQTNLIETEEKTAKLFFRRLLSDWEGLVLLFDNLILAEDYLNLGEKETYKRKDYNYLLKLRQLESNGADLKKTKTFKKIFTGLPQSRLSLESIGFFADFVEQNEEDGEKVDKFKENVKKQTLSKEITALNMANNKKLFSVRNKCFEEAVAQFSTQINEYLSKINQKREKEAEFKANWDSMLLNLK